MYYFSRHFKERMAERAITIDEVAAVIEKSVDVIVHPSKRDFYAEMHFGKINDRYIVIITNKFTGILITVRQMRKEEKDIYHKELGNEKKE